VRLCGAGLAAPSRRRAHSFAGGGKLLAKTLEKVNQGVCAAYCDRVIKLSDTLQPLPRSIVCNVHGVRADYLDVGRAAARTLPWRYRHSKGAYFLGKVQPPCNHRVTTV
jgi:digalactosyldiacylglycerol synthase